MARSQSAKIARAALDPLWQSIRQEVAGDAAREPIPASFLHATVSNHKSLEDALGGTGKAKGERHPKIRHGVLIGAGAKLLANVEVGRGAKVGVGSVVLEDVPPHCTVAGVPAEIVGTPNVDQPALEMDRRLPCNPNSEDCG